MGFNCWICIVGVNALLTFLLISSKIGAAEAQGTVPAQKALSSLAFMAVTSVPAVYGTVGLHKPVIIDNSLCSQGTETWTNPTLWGIEVRPFPLWMSALTSVSRRWSSGTP